MADVDQRVLRAFNAARERDLARQDAVEPASKPVRYIVTVTLDDTQRERMSTFLHSIGAGDPRIRLAPIEVKQTESEGGVTGDADR